MQNIKFIDYKDKIIAALEGKGYSFKRPLINMMQGTAIDNSYSIVEAFVNQPIQAEISGSVVIGGPSLPMVVIVENRSGKLEFFALKALLPDIQL